MRDKERKENAFEQAHRIGREIDNEVKMGFDSIFIGTEKSFRPFLFVCMCIRIEKKREREK